MDLAYFTMPLHPETRPFAETLRKHREAFLLADKLGLFKLDRDQPDEEITLALMVESLVIAGSVNAVVDQLLAFREEIGNFGTLVYNGPDSVDAALAKRSMELMAAEVMPRPNAAIGRQEAEE